MLTPVIELAGVPDAPAQSYTGAIEDGAVLLLHGVALPLEPGDERFFREAYADPKRKNVSIRGPKAELRGAAGSATDQEALRRVLIAFRAHARALIGTLLPEYAGLIEDGGTSYRPFDVAARKLSWRRDDSRLHVDAFPSNPARDRRLLRVFHNANGLGESRSWRVGEDFASVAGALTPGLPRYSSGLAALMHAAGLTKRRRTAYDHTMMHLHDRMKRDLAFQAAAPYREIVFAPGDCWITYSDQVPHAALGGRFLLEQTFYLDHRRQLDPAKSPQAVLGRLAGRAPI